MDLQDVQELSNFFERRVSAERHLVPAAAFGRVRRCGLLHLGSGAVLCAAAAERGCHCGAVACRQSRRGTRCNRTGRAGQGLDDAADRHRGRRGATALATGRARRIAGGNVAGRIYDPLRPVQRRCRPAPGAARRRNSSPTARFRSNTSITTSPTKRRRTGSRASSTPQARAVFRS